MPSEVSFRKEDDGVAWGFQLTGGARFGMPITVFEVTEGGRAYQAGIRLGDVLVKINGMDADQLELDEARHMILEAGNNITLSISNIEDQDFEDLELSEEIKAQILSESEEMDSRLHAADSSFEITDEREELKSDASSRRGYVDKAETDEESDEDVSNMKLAKMRQALDEMEDDVYVDVRSLPLKPPQPAPKPQKAQRKAWHPVMWESSPPPVVVEETKAGEELPHKQMMRNLRRAIAEGKVKPSPEVLIFFLCNKFTVSAEKDPRLRRH